MLEGGFGVFELFLAAQVAVVDDEAAGLGEVVLGGLPGVGFGAEEEARAVEVDVGQVEGHGAALGDFPGFVEVALRAVGAGGPVGEAAQPGAGEEAARELVLRAGAAEAGHGVVDFRGRGREAGLTCRGRWSARRRASRGWSSAW